MCAKKGLVFLSFLCHKKVLFQTINMTKYTLDCSDYSLPFQFYIIFLTLIELEEKLMKNLIKFHMNASYKGMPLDFIYFFISRLFLDQQTSVMIHFWGSLYKKQH